MVIQTVIAFGGWRGSAGIERDGTMELMEVIFPILNWVNCIWVCTYVKVLCAEYLTFVAFTKGKLYLNKVLLVKRCAGCYLDLGHSFEEVNTERKKSWVCKTRRIARQKCCIFI